MGRVEQEPMRQLLNALSAELRQPHRAFPTDDLRKAANNMAAVLTILANKVPLPEQQTLETFVGAAHKILARSAVVQ